MTTTTKEWHRLTQFDEEGRPDTSVIAGNVLAAAFPCTGTAVLALLLIEREVSEVPDETYLCEFGGNLTEAVASYSDMGIPVGWNPGVTKVGTPSSGT